MKFSVAGACLDLGISNDRTVSIGDSCFEASTDQLSFAAARSSCKSKHETGHLANLDMSQIQLLADSDDNGKNIKIMVKIEPHL